MGKSMDHYPFEEEVGLQTGSRWKFVNAQTGDV